MRSYEQFCSVARALDIVGDRWSLLIVRELLTQGPCRFTDLKSGLPTIATNLLSGRLRELESAGIIERQPMPPPIAATLLALTPRGAALAPVIQALGQWGATEMARGQGTDAFRHHWLAVPARLYLTDHDPQRPAQTVRLGRPPDAVTVTVAAGTIRLNPSDPRTSVDAVLDGPPGLLIRVLVGVVDLDSALELGLTVDGDASAVRRILPTAVPDRVPAR